MSNDTAARRDVASAMRAVASELTGSLDASQREKSMWPFPSDEERTLWFYTPTDHGGITLRDLSASQQRMVMRLLAAGLSTAGYATATTIIGLENMLDHYEGFSNYFGRERARDPLMYFLRFFGDPTNDTTWSWRFGGHHLSIHHLIVDGAVASFTPCFFGADPASTTLLGPHPLRPLGGVEDLARELVHALDPSQRSIALVSPVAPVDHVTANRSYVADGDLPLPLGAVWRGRVEGATGEQIDVMQKRMEERAGLLPEHLEAIRYTTVPKGLSVAKMTPAQKQMMRAVLDCYLRRMPDSIAEEEVAKFDGDRLDALTFLWAGSIEVGEGHYYRMQGPRLLVEYDNTQRNVNHVHSLWRDPEGDFGRDVLAEHYRAAH